MGARHRQSRRSGQAAQRRVEQAIAADTAAEKALKDMLYSEADRTSAKPAGYFEALKHKQSALIDFTDIVAASKEKLTKSSLESKGAPAWTKLHIRGYAHPSGVTPGVGMSPASFVDPLEQANKRIQLAFPTGARAATRALRTGIETLSSVPSVNALPVRFLFMAPGKSDEEIRRLAQKQLHPPAAAQQ